MSTRHQALPGPGRPAAALRRLACAGLLLWAAAAAAHEFWIAPDRFQVSPGETVTMSLRVGENFEGEPVGFGRPLVASLRHWSARGQADLGAVVPDAPQASVQVLLATPGTHLIALETHFNPSTLEAEKFNDYLREDGLWPVLRARERAGRMQAAGRERYRRNIKTLVQVGPRSDATYRIRVGHRLEILPLADPFRQAAAEPIAFQVLFDGRPLPHALFKLWHGEGEDRLVSQGLTDGRGRIASVLYRPGRWMASVVHMVPARGVADVDWESYWANLTFMLPGSGS